MSPKTFFCYYSLKTGSKIIGFLCTIGTCISICGVILSLQHIKTIYSYVIILFNSNTDYNPDVKAHFSESPYIKALQKIGINIISLMVFQAMYFLSSIFLLVGVCKDNPRFMVPWIIVEPIRQLIFLTFAVICTWISSILAREISVPVFVAVIALIIFSMASYFWMVVKAQRDRIQPATNKVFAK